MRPSKAPFEKFLDDARVVIEHAKKLAEASPEQATRQLEGVLTSAQGVCSGPFNEWLIAMGVTESLSRMTKHVLKTLESGGLKYEIDSTFVNVTDQSGKSRYWGTLLTPSAAASKATSSNIVGQVRVHPLLELYFMDASRIELVSLYTLLTKIGPSGPTLAAV